MPQQTQRHERPPGHAEGVADQNFTEPEANGPDLAPPSPDRRAIEKHPRANRWMHWINFPLLTIMIWSGLRIYWADRADPFGVGIGLIGWHWFDLFPDSFNEKLGLNRQLARGLAFHFTVGWLFALNGLAFGLYLLRSGGWRHLAPERESFSDAARVTAHDLHLSKRPLPPQGRYNGAQRLSYSLILFLGLIAVLTGLAIYKPTQLSFLTAIFGGYETAKSIHFFVTLSFVAFFIVHIFQVVMAGFSNFWSMITGYELSASADSISSDSISSESASSESASSESASSESASSESASSKALPNERTPRESASRGSASSKAEASDE